MSTTHSKQLAALLTQAREREGLSLRELAERSGVPKSTLSRLEQASVTQAKPDTLRALARALSVDVADLYSLVGYVEPSTLPTFAPYLRSKYADLPDEAQQELEAAFVRLVRQHGYDGNGPEPGEDEN